MAMPCDARLLSLEQGLPQRVKARQGRHHIWLFYLGAFALRGLDRPGRDLRRQRKEAIDKWGMQGLRTTRIQYYGRPFSFSGRLNLADIFPYGSPPPAGG